MKEHELDLLRAELLQEYSATEQYNCVLYTVIAAILAYAIQSDSYLVCLIPYLVILPMHFICQSKYDAMCRIGAYLYVFANEEEYHWEKRLHTYDKRVGHVKKRRILNHKAHLQYHIIPVCCSFAAIYKIVKSSYSYHVTWAIISIVVILTIFSLVLMNNTTVYMPVVRQTYIEHWTAIKNLEESANKSKNNVRTPDNSNQ